MWDEYNLYEYYDENPMTDEEIDAWEDKEYRKTLNLSRDEKGHLKKGAVLAKKRNCDEDDLWYLYSKAGWSVKEIVAVRGCSKSTVYNVIKKHKQKSDNK